MQIKLVSIGDEKIKASKFSHRLRRYSLWSEHTPTGHKLHTKKLPIVYDLFFVCRGWPDIFSFRCAEECECPESSDLIFFMPLTIVVKGVAGVLGPGTSVAATP